MSYRMKHERMERKQSKEPQTPDIKRDIRI